MKKRIAMMAAAAVLSVMMAVPSLAGSWKYDSNGWRYQRSASKYAIQEWVTVDGKKYYMDSNGFMVTGWQQIDGQWYYMDDTGAMQTGWLKDGLDADAYRRKWGLKSGVPLVCKSIQRVRRKKMKDMKLWEKRRKAQ